MTDPGSGPEYEHGQIADAFARNGKFVSFRGTLPEKELQKTVLSILNKWFSYQTGVYGTHWTGKRLILDAVLRPKNTAGWFDPDPVFGVEFKRASSQRHESLSKFTRWAAQAADEAQTNWDNYGRLTIFTCPPVTADCPYLDDQNEFFMTRFLGQHDVGELGLVPGAGWTLRHSGENYWTETHGPGQAAKSLIPKRGSSR